MSNEEPGKSVQGFFGRVSVGTRMVGFCLEPLGMCGPGHTRMVAVRQASLGARVRNFGGRHFGAAME